MTVGWVDCCERYDETVLSVTPASSWFKAGGGSRSGALEMPAPTYGSESILKLGISKLSQSRPLMRKLGGLGTRKFRDNVSPVIGMEPLASVNASSVTG